MGRRARRAPRRSRCSTGSAPPHRAALTLRYLDDLPVPEVAALLGRTLHATEALLVRARAAFRRAYEPRAAGRCVMTDPTRSPPCAGRSTPVDPDPAFAAALRDRLARALAASSRPDPHHRWTPIRHVRS